MGSYTTCDLEALSTGTAFELTFFDISGALWDEDTFVISLEEGHYAAYIKNYMAMQIIFGSGVATGREALIAAITDLPTHHLCCFAVFGLFEVFLVNQLFDQLFGLHSCLLFEVFLVNQLCLVYFLFFLLSMNVSVLIWLLFTRLFNLLANLLIMLVYTSVKERLLNRKDLFWLKIFSCFMLETKHAQPASGGYCYFSEESTTVVLRGVAY
ncbi:hypothetical protein ACJX0J_008513 [Zea mays]